MSKKKGSLLSKALVVLALLTVSAIATVGTPYYRSGLPKYKVGDCLRDNTQPLVLLGIEGIRKDKYQVTVVYIILPVEQEISIRELNKADMTLISCDTGDTLK